MTSINVPSNIVPASLILIIDDSVTMAKVLGSVLQKYARVIMAHDGKTGIEMAQQYSPHLILLDVEMPGMNGYEVCKQLKEIDGVRDSPVIFLTANTSQESEIEGLQAGAVDFITKPMRPPIIEARVNTHLMLFKQNVLLRELAHRDGLTSLFNRRYFDDQLARELLRHCRLQQALSLAFIDIDHFKLYNDFYGHQDGDACLQKVAGGINNATHRGGDLVARYGGEEFVAILPHTKLSEAEEYGNLICEKIRSLRLPHEKSSTADYVTISVGLASIIPTPSDTGADLIAKADKALYHAKRNGRNCAKIHIDE